MRVFVLAALPPTAACMSYIQSASNVIYLYCDSDSVCACVSVCHSTGECQVTTMARLEQQCVHRCVKLAIMHTYTLSLFYAIIIIYIRYN